jgi:hypothetical protein
MKKLIFPFLFFMITIGMVGENFLEETRKLDPFNKVIAAHGINVKLVYNDLEEAYVKVKGAGLEEVITEVEDMTLKVRMKARFNQDVTVMVELSYKQLSRIEANTGAYIETVRPLWGESMYVYSVTGGVIKAESEVEKVVAVTSGVSEIELYGKAQQLDATANLGAKIKAFGLKADEVIAHAKSGSDIQILALEKADIKSSLGSVVQLKGDPDDKQFKTSLGGEIKELGLKPEHGLDLIRDAD